MELRRSAGILLLAVGMALLAPPALAEEADPHVSIEGTIVGETGRGELEDAWIHAIPASSAAPEVSAGGGFYGFPPGFGIWYRPVPVDGDGHFEMRLPPGRYHLRAGARGYRDALTTLRVTKEGPNLASPLRLTWDGVARLRVRALFEDGTPVSCRAVRVALRWGQGLEAETGASTDDEGYCVLCVRPETYRVRLVEPRPGTASMDAVAQDGRLADVGLRIGAGAFVAGRAVDAEGRPVAGAAITALPLRGPRDGLPELARWALYGSDWHTGADGTFLVGPIAPGWSVLAIRRAGAARGCSTPLRLEQSGRLDNVEVRLAEVDAGEGDLLVRVLRDGGGGPVAGAEVSVRTSRGTVVGEAPGAARTNAHGFAGLSQVPAGDLQVEAVLTDPSSGLVVAGRARTGLRHGQHRELNVSIRKAVALEGSVTGLAGRPLAGARVAIRPRGDDTDAYAPVATGKDGRFKLPLLYADEAYEIAVEAAGHVGRTIVIKPGEVKSQLDMCLGVAR